MSAKFHGYDFALRTMIDFREFSVIASAFDGAIEYRRTFNDASFPTEEHYDLFKYEVRTAIEEGLFKLAHAEAPFDSTKLAFTYRVKKRRYTIALDYVQKNEVLDVLNNYKNRAVV